MLTVILPEPVRFNPFAQKKRPVRTFVFAPPVHYEYTTENDEHELREFPLLWDLNYWNSLKDIDEILEWLEEIKRWDGGTGCVMRNVKGNCNNLRYNIRRLMKLGGYSMHKVARIMMENKHVV